MHQVGADLAAVELQALAEADLAWELLAFEAGLALGHQVLAEADLALELLAFEAGLALGHQALAEADLVVELQALAEAGLALELLAWVDPAEGHQAEVVGLAWELLA